MVQLHAYKYNIEFNIKSHQKSPQKNFFKHFFWSNLFFWKSGRKKKK